MYLRVCVCVSIYRSKEGAGGGRGACRHIPVHLLISQAREILLSIYLRGGADMHSQVYFLTSTDRYFYLQTSQGVCFYL